MILESENTINDKFKIEYKINELDLINRLKKKNPDLQKQYEKKILAHHLYRKNKILQRQMKLYQE